MASTPDQSSDDLDILGQLPGLNIYTQICFCYETPNIFSHQQIVETLQRGLAKLANSFPWVASRVYCEGEGEANSGLWKFKSLEKTPRLIVKDLTNDSTLPSFQDLREANFPIQNLDESLYAPIVTLPTLAPETDTAKDSPVFALQVTFIKGGLLLTFVAEHRTMDGVGQGQVLNLLSKACSGLEFTQEELIAGNLPRKNLIPYFDSGFVPGSELSDQIKSRTPSIPASGESPTPSTWANFSFSANSLALLKRRAMESVSTENGGFISTDDAITAFAWQSIIRSRLTRLDPELDIKFARAVDVRHLFNVPPTYTGMLQNMTYHTLKLRDLVQLPLGIIAAHLRRAIDPKTSTLIHDTRSLATHLNQKPDKSMFSLSASLELYKDLMLSSWAKLNAYDLEFSLGVGKPVAVRRPRFNPFESLGYFLPRSPSGEIVLAICLRDDDLGILRSDEEWNKFAVFVG